MKRTVYVWLWFFCAVTVLVSLGFFTILNFGPLSPVTLSEFFLSPSQLLTGLDLVLVMEFVLIVIAIPFSLAMWIRQLSLRGKITPFRRKFISVVALLLATAVIWSGIEVEAQEDPIKASSEGPGRAPPAKPLQLTSGTKTNLVHIFMESLSSDVYFSDSIGYKHKDLLSEAMGAGANVVELQWPVSTSPNTFKGLSISLCGTVRKPTDKGIGDPLCLPQLLADRGYRNIFVQSASGEFQGKQMFLEQLSFQVYERETWQAIGALEPTVSWGQSTSDDRLFNHAKAVVQGLHASENPYYLAGLTLDTHYPHFVPAACESGNASWPEISYICSSKAVAEFISWLRENVRAPTLIVLQGDHQVFQTSRGFSGSDEVYFSYTCTGEWLVDKVPPPTNFSFIPSFIASTLSKCG